MEIQLRKWIVLLWTGIVSITANAQTRAEEQERLSQAITWLEQELTYNYYNGTDDEWWINRFTYNTDSKSVTIKNIASPKPEAVTDKTYLQLRFKLEDLNPYTIKIEEIESNRGRLVAGKAIRVGAYDRSIQRTKNGRLSTDQSFIYISIPKYLEDSIGGYASSIVEKMSAAIRLATRIYPTENSQENAKVLSGMLPGKFKSKDVDWHIQVLFPNVLEINAYDPEQSLLHKLFLKFISGKNTLDLTMIAPDLPQKTYHLTLQKDGFSYQDSTAQVALNFSYMNEFSFFYRGENKLFIRDWSFE